MSIDENAKLAEIFCRRKRWGRGFQYYDHLGEKVICKKLLGHFKGLAVPPMWKEVEICIDATYKIQAVGRDAKNRKQYIYAEEWQAKRQAEKFAKLSKFAHMLPGIRERCDTLLKQKKDSKARVLAVMVKVLDETGIRIGNQQYTKRNGTYGLSTLRRRHVQQDDDEFMFEFVGKSNKLRQVSIEDEQLQSHIKTLVESPGYDIFRYKDAQGKWQSVGSDDLNEFLQTEFDPNLSAKYFRTWNGTCHAVEAFYHIDKNKINKRTLPENLVVKSVAKTLGNTEAICRDYYIHPKVLERISEDNMPSKFANTDTEDSASHSLSAIESLTLKLIKE